jgi:hypothetical protein
VEDDALYGDRVGRPTISGGALVSPGYFRADRLDVALEAGRARHDG